MGEARMDLQRGEIVLATGLVLGPRLRESELRRASPAGLRTMVHNPPYHSYAMSEVRIAGRAFVPVVYFESGVPQQVEVHAVDPAGPSWDNYTEEGALAMKRDNDKLIEQVAGRPPPCRFDWGRADSWHDPRSGSVAISLRFT